MGLRNSYLFITRKHYVIERESRPVPICYDPDTNISPYQRASMLIYTFDLLFPQFGRGKFAMFGPY